MKWALCWGVAMQVDTLAPRTSGRSVQASLSEPIKFKSYRSIIPARAVRDWRNFWKPFQDTHFGKVIGRVLFAQIVGKNYLVFGFCETNYLKMMPTVSVGIVGSNDNEHADLEHVAVYTNSLCAFDTFLKPWPAWLYKRKEMREKDRRDCQSHQLSQ